MVNVIASRKEDTGIQTALQGMLRRSISGILITTTVVSASSLAGCGKRDYVKPIEGSVAAGKLGPTESVLPLLLTSSQYAAKGNPKTPVFVEEKIEQVSTDAKSHVGIAITATVEKGSPKPADVSIGSGIVVPAIASGIIDSGSMGVQVSGKSYTVARMEIINAKGEGVFILAPDAVMLAAEGSTVSVGQPVAVIKESTAFDEFASAVYRTGAGITLTDVALIIVSIGANIKNPNPAQSAAALGRILYMDGGYAGVFPSDIIPPMEVVSIR